MNIYSRSIFVTDEREKALGVQAGLTSVVNEIVVLVMVGGVGSTAARGLRRPAGSSSWPGTTSTDLRQPSLGWPDVRLHASNPVLITIVTQGAVGLEKSRDAAGRAAKASGATGSGGGENAGVVDLSSEEPNMNDARNCV
jgi:hypothetical protein